MPSTSRRLITEQIAVCAHDVAVEHAPGIIEGYDVERAAQDEREFGSRLMAMGSEV
jgi:hypothetical protein